MVKMSNDVHVRMSGGHWVAALRKDPALANKCEWEMLSGDDWRRLLKHCPQYSDRCDWDKLDGRNWRRLLVTQPQFASQCDWTKLSAEDWHFVLVAQPQLYDKRDWGTVDVADWMRLLDACPNKMVIASRCDKWSQFGIGSLCELLREHPQLSAYCPDEVWRKFKLIHWATLIREPGVTPAACRTFIAKMSGLARDKLIADWCCPHHWAEEYYSLIRRCYAIGYETSLSSDCEMMKRLAESSAMNPYGTIDSQYCRFGSDIGKHIRWLASVADDCDEAAAIENGATHPGLKAAKTYALIAAAAKYEISILKKQVRGWKSWWRRLIY